MDDKIETKTIPIPKVSIATAVMGAIWYLSSFMQRNVPYEAINFQVFLTVLFDSSLKIIFPFLGAYVLLTFINSGKRNFIKDEKMQKLYNLSIKLFLSIFFLTLGFIILIKIATIYPSIVGWKSNAIVYLMIGLAAVYLDRGILNKNETFLESLITILPILGIFYSISIGNNFLLISFIIITLFMTSLAIRNTVRKKSIV